MVKKRRPSILEELEARDGANPRKIKAWWVKLIGLMVVGGGIAYAFVTYQ